VRCVVTHVGPVMQEGKKACASASADMLNTMFNANFANPAVPPSLACTSTALQAERALLRSRCLVLEG
jgi:hypothetical protein